MAWRLTAIFCSAGLTLFAGLLAGATESTYTCRLRGEVFLQDNYFLTHGQDAWFGPGVVSCRELGSGRALDIPVTLRYEGRTQGFGAFRRERYEISAEDVGVSRPEELFGIFPALGGRLRILGIHGEIHFAIQLPRRIWQFHLHVEDPQEPSLAAFTHIGELSILQNSSVIPDP